ncbi:MAG: UDP-glucuronic acid dehydrogenase [Pseudomonadota bacterium]
MKISILCSDSAHPIYPYLVEWARCQGGGHQVDIAARKAELAGGDILFLISCHELIREDIRSLYKATLVIHASDLPLGRGWSPHIWQVLEKKQLIKVTLLEAADALDSGAIWAQDEFRLEGHETFDEINTALFAAELRLMDFAVKGFETVKPRPQDSRQSTSYPKRAPEDSRIDPLQSIAGQFDLLRVADPVRFPAFFELHGHRYLIQISKDKKHAEE